MNKPAIEAEARAAAAARVPPVDACPYRYTSDEGMHWLAVYYLSL